MWHAPRAELADDDYRGGVRFAREPPAFVAGERHEVWVEVANDGGARWPGGDERDPLIRVADELRGNSASFSRAAKRSSGGNDMLFAVSLSFARLAA